MYNAIDSNTVIQEIYDLNTEIEEEREKPEGEYSRERERELIWRQVVQAMKLSATPYVRMY